MPFATGTATDHNDLFEKVRAFVKTNAALVSASRQWTERRYDGTAKTLTLKAPGLTGTEDITLAVRTVADVANDTYQLGFQLSQAYDAGFDHFNQPGNSGERFMPIWNQAMPYWIVANGQRLILVAKVSTVYVAAYMGKFLEYGTPGEYPQPYYCGACTSSAAVRWSVANANFRGFQNPGTGARILLPGGTWHDCQNYYDSAGNQAPKGGNQVWPYASTLDGNDQERVLYNSLRESIDGSYTLMPLILIGNDPDRDQYGELDGAYALSGFGNASENTITIGADTYVVFQDVYRTTRADYWALKLA